MRCTLHFSYLLLIFFPPPFFFLRLHLHPLNVFNHRVDYSDTGNGGVSAKKKKQTTTTTNNNNKKQKTNKQTNKTKKTAAYRWSLRTPDVKTSRDMAPATASVSESFQSGMARGRNECLRLFLRAEIHGYTGCKRTGFVKPDSVKLARGHLLHDEAGP